MITISFKDFTGIKVSIIELLLENMHNTIKKIERLNRGE